VLDVRKLRLFVAVYEDGSLSRAAEREHLAQPALSVHIQQLEDDLQVKLFERSVQGMIPLPAGRRLYALSIDLLRRVQQVGADMSQFSGTLSGSVTAGIMPSICHGPLATMLGQFTETYPNVALRIVEGLSGTLAQWVLSEDVDFAVCTLPASTRGLHSRRLLHAPMVLVSGKGAGFAPFEPLDLARIGTLRLVLPSANHSLRQTLDAQISQFVFKPLQTLEIDGQSATLQFVAHSNWSTILPSIAVIHEAGPDRVTINPILRPAFTMDIYELRLLRNVPSAAGERFIAMLESSLLAVTAPASDGPEGATLGYHE